MRAPITLDLHITNFNYPDTPPERLLGKLLSVAGVLNSPRPIRGDIPTLVGGSGERKTVALVGETLAPIFSS
jgi:alkanesulfonate monooxygenase SsuD/methylene tetrahydromethanopterin reductase-like flavin-dependent oxidoreductase (luciferase family)